MTRFINRTILSLALLLCLVLNSPLPAENASLAQRYPKEKLQQILLPRGQWHPLPKGMERARWEAIPREARQYTMTLGEQYATSEIPPLPATLYLEFRRIGNRSRFQDAWLQRRKMLNCLVLAECIEGKGRFLDPIANIVWAICEESSWAFPAHIGAQRAGVGLPDTAEPIVALFSAETACSLAWAVYLLEKELDGVSPQLSQRVGREIDARILTPYLDREDFGWMGFGSRRRPNNWNPWVNSNVLAAGLLLERNEQRRVELVHKVLRSLDNFLVPYPSDGSCDEGPSYWGRAGASLFENLDLVQSATGGQFDVFDDQVVKEIGQFIYRTHITNDYFVNVGDCDARIIIPHDLVFRYGRRIGDPDMMALGTCDLNLPKLLEGKRGIWSVARPLYALFDLSALEAEKSQSAPLVRDVWLADADMQLMAARDAAGSSDGLYVAAWGGHNGQSHNHNDVGNFIVYANGRPFIIDVGRPVYTRQTFSRDRYKIWAMQSAYHNLPTINDCMQEAGGQYAAQGVCYRVDDDAAELEMDIAGAYPSDAGIASWIRTVHLERGESVEVSDAFRLKQATTAMVQNLMTPCEVTGRKPGQVQLTDCQTKTSVLVQYDPDQLTLQLEVIPLDDATLTKVWGPQLYRILLKARSPQAEGVWKLRVSQVP